MSSVSALHKKSMVIIFAFAPAGLGHLRVTDALYEGLPPEVSPLLLGSHDTFITFFHRVMSVHPVTRSIFEWVQRGRPENLFTYLYRSLLRTNTNSIYKQIETILEQRLEIPKTILVVATHFGLAHQLAVIKNKLSKKDIRMILAVQVTDDSPQAIWYVEGADVIYVPSEITKQKLIRYGRRSQLSPVQFVVNPYPVSPLLSEDLSEYHYEERVAQLNPASKASIHIAVPVSGAAVGTEFTTKLVQELYMKIPRVRFHIIAKEAPYIQKFRADISPHKYIQWYSFMQDRDVVNEYERLYNNEVISLEITKPSEQAFKALLKPHQKGGSILLFSHAVGRQEYDNVDFLRRNCLIPSSTQQNYLFELAKKNIIVDHNFQLKDYVKNWRGVILPDGHKQASQFIFWCLHNALFKHMLNYQLCDQKINKNEVNPNGVQLFWEKTAQLIQDKV